MGGIVLKRGLQGVCNHVDGRCPENYGITMGNAGVVASAPRKLWQYAPKTMAIESEYGAILQPRPGNYGNRASASQKLPKGCAPAATIPRSCSWQKPPSTLCGSHISQLRLCRLSSLAAGEIVSFCENSQGLNVENLQHCRNLTFLINSKKLLFARN
jgi:hypothetical protein